jgi:hypothetical protein
MQKATAHAQRFRSSLAFLAPHFDRVAGNVLDRIAREFPGAPGVPFKTKRGRYDLAADIATVAKHADNPVPALGTLKRLGAWLEEAGLTDRDRSRLQAMIVSEAKAAAGNTWSDQLEYDWNTIVHSVLALVPLPAAAAKRNAA